MRQDAIFAATTLLIKSTIKNSSLRCATAKDSRYEGVQVRTLSNSSSLLRAGLASGLTGVFATSGIGSEEQYTRVVNESDRLLQVLESIPYVAEGRGIPVYVLMSQTCPFCKALWRDHGKVKASIQFRWIPLPYTKDDRDQLAHVLKSRSAQDFVLRPGFETTGCAYSGGQG